MNRKIDRIDVINGQAEDPSLTNDTKRSKFVMTRVRNRLEGSLYICLNRANLK